MAIKSLVTHVEIDTAARSHNCQASAKHRIQKGDVRLKVKKGRSWDHYCLAGAKNRIGRDIEKLAVTSNNQLFGSDAAADACSVVAGNAQLAAARLVSIAPERLICPGVPV